MQLTNILQDYCTHVHLITPKFGAEISGGILITNKMSRCLGLRFPATSRQSSTKKNEEGGKKSTWFWSQQLGSKSTHAWAVRVVYPSYLNVTHLFCFAWLFVSFDWTWQVLLLFFKILLWRWATWSSGLWCQFWTTHSWDFTRNLYTLYRLYCRKGWRALFAYTHQW